MVERNQGAVSRLEVNGQAVWQPNLVIGLETQEPTCGPEKYHINHLDRFEVL